MNPGLYKPAPNAPHICGLCCPCPGWSPLTSTTATGDGHRLVTVVLPNGITDGGPECYAAENVRLPQDCNLRLVLRLCEAEPVSGIVPHQCLDPVELLFWRGQKFHAFGLKLFVGLAAIARLEDATAKLAPGEQVAQSCRHIRLHVWAIHLHENKLQVGLPFRTNGEPAKAIVHRGIHANIEAQFVNVKVARRVLIEHVYGGMRKSLNHKKASSSPIS